MIHPTAIIHPGASIGDGVRVGPYAVIGDAVTIGDGSSIGSHTLIHGPARIGRENQIHAFCSIGTDPQDRKFAGESESELEIGDGNVIREYCSINRGTRGGGGVTRIGTGNWILAYVHIAHDCHVGDRVLFANNATLAGHVRVDDDAVLGGFTGVHQFCRIGRCALTAISSVVVKDVPPFVIVSGNTARPRCLNRIGLRRHGYGEAAIHVLQSAFRTVYREHRLLAEALAELKTLAQTHPEVAEFVSFFNGTVRGVVR